MDVTFREFSEETAIRRCHLWFSHWHPSTVPDRTIENIARLAQASDIKVEIFVFATLTIAFFYCLMAAKAQATLVLPSLSTLFSKRQTPRTIGRSRGTKFAKQTNKNVLHNGQCRRGRTFATCWKCRLPRCGQHTHFSTYYDASQSNCKEWNEEAAPENNKTTRMVNKFQLAHAKDVGRQISS